MTVVDLTKLTISNQINESMRKVKLNGLVGFETLPNQIVAKCLKDGFRFNILCIGETGIGKSTLMDNLFNTKFDWIPSSHCEPQVRLNKNIYNLQENGCLLKLSIIETVGYGDQIDKNDSLEILSNYVDIQFEKYLQEELKIKRDFTVLEDSRIHVCLFFLSPTGHSIKSFDLNILSKLSDKVNIIPIIAKSDTISKIELNNFKKTIMKSLVDNQVKIYQFPLDDDLEFQINSPHLPFAVVSSSETLKIGNKVVRARQYPWGIVVIENEQHNDFIKLREMLLKTFTLDLIEKTQFVHYEKYRRIRLIELGFSNIENGKELSLSETYEAKLTELKSQIKIKEDEIKQKFVEKVKSKEAELKEIERELNDRYAHFKEKSGKKKDRLEELKRVLETDIKEFQRRKSFLEQHKLHSLASFKNSKKK